MDWPSAENCGSFGGTIPPMADYGTRNSTKKACRMVFCTLQGFSVINPTTCVGLIQIKHSVSNLSKFQNRLREIAQTHFFGRRPGMVMGIIVSDVTPEKKSIVHRYG